MSRIVAGKYALETLLGRGSMGSVYQARHILTGQEVALKLISPEIAHTANGQHRFSREIRIAASVGHPGLVQVYDAGTDPETETLYLAMERLQGENLKDRSRQIDFSLRLGLQFVRSTLDALAAAHAHGFVHRDIKPENIFIHCPKPNVEVVKLLDFGIARDLAEGAQSSTAAHIALGTPHYMSPEQATNAKEVTAASDVWSVGVMLYWLLAGRLPFDEDTAFNTLAKVCSIAPDGIDPRGSELRRQLSELTYRCLAKDPDLRPANAAMLSSALDSILGPFVMASSQESAAYNYASATIEEGAPAFGPYATPPLSADLVLPPAAIPNEITVPFAGASSAPVETSSSRRRFILPVVLLLLGTAGAGSVWWIQKEASAIEQVALPPPPPIPVAKVEEQPPPTPAVKAVEPPPSLRPKRSRASARTRVSSRRRATPPPTRPTPVEPKALQAAPPPPVVEPVDKPAPPPPAVIEVKLVEEQAVPALDPPDAARPKPKATPVDAATPRPRVVVDAGAKEPTPPPPTKKDPEDFLTF